MTSNRPVAIFPSRAWGPRPRWALLPLAGVAAVAATLLARPDRPAVATAAAVTALEPPADGSAAPVAASPAVPIEVAHGVPSPDTLHLWLPGRGSEARAVDAG